jgi:hypothetical protein
MKKSLFIVVLIALCVVLPFAASADTGIGIIVGDPTGVSLLFNERIAMGLAWDLSNHLHVHGDYWLMHSRLEGELDWYLGVGAKLLVFNDGSSRGPSWNSSDEENEDSIGVGVRIPIGLQWYATPELEIFGEIVPGMFIIPSTDFDIDLGIGIRYHF